MSIDCSKWKKPWNETEIMLSRVKKMNGGWGKQKKSQSKLHKDSSSRHKKGPKI
jgi:hypothetical protein